MMHFAALRIPTPAGPVVIAARFARLENLCRMDGLPGDWQGIPAVDGKACLRYSPRGSSVFHALQLFENTRYYIAIPEGRRLSASFANREPIPGRQSEFFVSIDNYLGTAWIQVDNHPRLYFDVVSAKLDYYNEYRAIVEAIAFQCNQLLRILALFRDAGVPSRHGQHCRGGNHWRGSESHTSFH